MSGLSLRAALQQRAGLMENPAGGAGRLGSLNMSALDTLSGTRIPAEKLKVTPCDGNCGSCGRCQDAKKGRMEIQFLPQVDLGALESLMQGEAAGRNPAAPEGAGRISDRLIELDLRRTRLREDQGSVKAVLNPMEAEESWRGQPVMKSVEAVQSRSMRESPRTQEAHYIARSRPLRDAPPAAVQIPQFSLETKTQPEIRDLQGETAGNLPAENGKRTPAGRASNASAKPGPSEQGATPVSAPDEPPQRSYACEGTLATISTMALKARGESGDRVPLPPVQGTAPRLHAGIQPSRSSHAPSARHDARPVRPPSVAPAPAHTPTTTPPAPSV
ncbi:MAG: hypothetical protein AB1324_03295, partial [Candidatus Micrarchaeota archaeon]